MEYYGNIGERYLEHHGILGQKWGKRNGPPYPLGESDHSSSEKKAGWKKSLGLSDEQKEKLKKAAKIGAIAAGSALALYGAYSLASSGVFGKAVAVGKDYLHQSIQGIDFGDKRFSDSNGPVMSLVKAAAKHINPQGCRTNCVSNTLALCLEATGIPARSRSIEGSDLSELMKIFPDSCFPEGIGAVYANDIEKAERSILRFCRRQGQEGAYGLFKMATSDEIRNATPPGPEAHALFWCIENGKVIFSNLTQNGMSELIDAGKSEFFKESVMSNHDPCTFCRLDIALKNGTYDKDALNKLVEIL